MPLPLPTTSPARASTVGREETYHVGPLVPRRADGREARCPTGPQYERNVPRARRHAYRALRPGGEARPTQRAWRPGVADRPHGETNPGWRATRPSPNRAGMPEAERCYRVNGVTPCVVHRGATSLVHRGRRWPTRPNTRRRRPPLSHRGHRGTPRPHSRYHQAQGQEAAHQGESGANHATGRVDVRGGGHLMARSRMTGIARGEACSRGDRPRSRPMETLLAQATCGAQGQRPPRPEMGTPYGRVTCHD